MNGSAHLESADSAPPAPPRVHPAPPLTGDTALDEAMTALARAQTEPFGERVTSGEQFHQLLQARLDDLGRA